MTSDPGTYALLLRADATRDIEVGALGTLTVRPGAYVYVGSAFGPGGAQARVRRHAWGEGSMHWHIDYLRAVTTLEAVWYTHDDTRRECSWAQVLHDLQELHLPMVGFGASDCDCLSHLVRFDRPPPFGAFRNRVWRACFDHAPLRKLEKPVLE